MSPTSSARSRARAAGCRSADARPHRGERGDARERRRRGQRRPGRRAGRGARLVPRPRVPVRPGAHQDHGGRRRGGRHLRRVQRPAGRRLLRAGGDPGLARGRRLPAGRRGQRGRRGGLPQLPRQQPRLPDPRGVRLRAPARAADLLSVPRGHRRPRGRALRAGVLRHRDRSSASSGAPRWTLAFLGGLLVGVLVLLSKGLLVGHGHLAVHLDVFGGMSWSSLALLALGSILATSITLNFGGSGGVFTPSLYVGAATGGAFGVALTGLFPDLGLRPEAYALVGMGAVVAASTSAPDHRHAARLRDDQRLRDRPAAHADHGDRQPGGAPAGARLALQRLAPAPRRAAPARRRPRRARRAPGGGRLRPRARRSWARPPRSTSCWSTWAAARSPTCRWWTSSAG